MCTLSGAKRFDADFLLCYLLLNFPYVDEAISLYGSVMMHAFGDGTAEDAALNEKALTARRVSLMGRLLTATEIRSAQRYWHVLHGDASSNIYPKR